MQMFYFSDLIKDIRDPEKPETLEELNVVCEENVSVRQFNDSDYLVKVVFIPTVPHCSLASIIGKNRPRGYKTFFKLSSAECEILTAHK